MTHPRISIVVPVFNKAPVLVAALDSIVAAARTYGNADLIVVDHGSTDGSRALLQARYVQQARVADFGGGTIASVRNYGARGATGSVLSFIDADCVIPLDYFARLADVLAETGASATGAEVVPPRSPSWVEDVWYQLHRRGADGEREWIGSANLAVVREDFEAVGGFDETLVTGEDTELCQRLRTRGCRIYESKRLTAVHLDNAKTLGAFYRKERWRGLGMFGTVRPGSIDKPTVMTVTHLGLCGSAILVLAAGRSALPVRFAVATALVCAVPALTLWYRSLGGGRLPRPLHALLLYQVYYAARSSALAKLLFGKGQASDRGGRPL